MQIEANGVKRASLRGARVRRDADYRFAPAACSVLEWFAVGLIVAGFVAFGMNSIHNHVFVGQDFGYHNDLVRRYASHLPDLFKLDATSPPLFYAIGALMVRLTAGAAYLEGTAYVFLAMNTVALLVFHALTRYAIESALLRIAAVVFWASLPPNVIHSVVFAGDGMTPLPFQLICLGLIKLGSAVSTRGFVRALGWTLGGVILGNVSKYTFIAVFPATVILFVYFWRTGLMSTGRALIALIAITVLPGAGALWMRKESDRVLAVVHPSGIGVRSKPTGRMSFRSLLVPYERDRRIFQAPSYNMPVYDAAGQHRRDYLGRPMWFILMDNEFSYPALLHLGLFNDYGNYAIRGLEDGWGLHNRPPAFQRRMELSVKTGVWFHAAMWASVIGAMAAIGMRFWLGGRPALTEMAMSAVVWPALGMFAIIVVFMPFVDHPYYWGTWTPRLILAALSGFFLLTYAMADRLLAGRPVWGRVAVLGLTLFQGGLHASFLWG